MTFYCNYRLFVLLIIIFCLFSIYHPDRHAKHYFYIPINKILDELVQFQENKYSNLKQCSYEHVIKNNYEISINDIFKKYNYELPQPGGEYMPRHCESLFKVAIIIPYRNRPEQLEIFLNYMHHFLQNQYIHYRIYVVDQQDNLLFNRAKLFNIGAQEAINADFPCLILHDVDLIPLTTGNMYVCAKQPRHMSSSLDTFRFNLPYEGLSGGVISIQTFYFKRINGMSNLFEGWGGEDDDFYSRLEAINYLPYRFAPQFSKYTMLKHKKAKPSENRYQLLHSTLERQKMDGLSSLPHFSLNLTIKEEFRYTHVIVL